MSRLFDLLQVPMLAGATAALIAVEGIDMAAAQPERSRYEDGTYTADGLYGGQPSKLTVTVTLKDGRITATSVGTHATNPISLDYQRSFAAAVPGAVRGKRIDEVRVGKLAGSSGCPDGFNAALERIRREAAR